MYFTLYNPINDAKPINEALRIQVWTNGTRGTDNTAPYSRIGEKPDFLATADHYL